jgi:hypothetical protein
MMNEGVPKKTMLTLGIIFALWAQRTWVGLLTTPLKPKMVGTQQPRPAPGPHVMEQIVAGGEAVSSLS